MKKIILQLKKHGQLTAFCLVCACILLSVLLLPREQNFKGPEQEYADNKVKTGTIIFSKP